MISSSVSRLIKKMTVRFTGQRLDSMHERRLVLAQAHIKKGEDGNGTLGVQGNQTWDLDA